MVLLEGIQRQPRTTTVLPRMDAEMTLYVSERDLAKRYSVSRTAPWDWARLKPDIPQPVKLSDRITRWRLDEIEAWEAAQRNAA